MTPASVAGARLEAAVTACQGLGAALRAIRGQALGEHREASGGQLKTTIDAAAEGWLLGFLKTRFPGDRFLAEEQCDEGGSPPSWFGSAAPYWTVDALDGTRSFVDGFKGFCVQTAWIEDGAPRFGVVHRPVSGSTYWGVQGGGAWLRLASGRQGRLGSITEPDRGSHARGGRFVDSVFPSGELGRRLDAEFDGMVELGSYGLKLIAVAVGRARVFVKQAGFALWDVAPAQVILAEVGGHVVRWDGGEIDYTGGPPRLRNLIAGRRDELDLLRTLLCPAVE